MLSSLLLVASMAPALADEPAPFPAPDRPGAVMPARGWDVVHLDLSVDIQIEEGTVVGRTLHRVEPLARPSTRLRLNQVGLDIDRVLVDGEPAAFDVGPGRLDIPLQPGEPHEVVVHYRARPQLGMHFRVPGQDGATYREVWTQGEGEDHQHWFPSWDHPTDRFTLDTHVTVPADLSVVANGDWVDQVPTEDGRTTWSFSLDERLVNYLVVIAAGEYREHVHEGARIPVSSFVDADLPEAATAGMETAVPMLAWFDEVLGTPYAYARYRQVTVQSFMYGGMENTTATVLAERLLAREAWDDPRRMESVVAHELAHQWFGDLLTCYGWRELWLNEGFATYWTNRWMEHAWGEGYAAVRWRRNLASARGQRHPMALRSWSAREGDDDNHNVYNRGASVLRMLEVFLGRDALDAGIRRYVSANADRLVETEDLRRALEDVSGEHLGWLFDQWVYRPGAPTFAVKHRFVGGDGEDPGRLEITLDQEGDGPVWIAPVTVEVGTPEGPERHRTWVDQRTTRIVVEATEAPRWVFADPDQGVIATWKQHQDPAQWAAALEGSPSWGVRLEALHALADPEHGDVEALVRGATPLAEDTSLDRRVRAEAAQVLGRSVTDEAATALLALSDSPSAEVRAAALAGLGKQETSDAVSERLARASTRDPHARAQAAALSALASHDEDLAVRTARRSLDGPDPLASAAFRIVGEHGKPADRGRLTDALDTARPRWMRRAAASALWKLVDRFHEDERLRERASRAVEPLLDSRDVRVRSHAIYVLGGMGDEPAARRLQRYAAETLIDRHRDRALDAARDIRRRSEPDAPPPTPDDLERIQERVDALQKRLDELEDRI